MILGIPKEVLENESRVAAIPITIKQYISAGFDVIVQSGAGNLSQISDEDYKEVFEHEKGIPVKSAKFDKASIYEKMLPSIALVVVLLDE